MLTTTDVRNVTQGHRVPDHQVLPIGGGTGVRVWMLAAKHWGHIWVTKRGHRNLWQVDSLSGVRGPFAKWVSLLWLILFAQISAR